MYTPLKKVNFYRRTLMTGCLHNLTEQGGISLCMKDTLRPAAYITQLFDTGDQDCTFNRLRVEGRFENVKLEVVAVASQTREALMDGSPVELDRYFADPKGDMDQKAAAMRVLPGLRRTGAQDILLHGLKGRYVWIMVRVDPAGDALCQIDGISLEFPRESFTDYLPEIYRQNEFFDRYIAILQSLYLDLEDRAEALPRQLDYETTSDSLVPELAGWLGLDNCAGLLDTSQMRHLIRHAGLYQEKKGTRAALKQILALATGIEPRILEHFDWETEALSSQRRQEMIRLYGGSPNCFCVILDWTGDQKERPIAELNRLIEDYSPMGTHHKLICLKHTSRLGTHCYLDVNSTLASPETASVDGITLGNYIMVG